MDPDNLAAWLRVTDNGKQIYRAVAFFRYVLANSPAPLRRVDFDDEGATNFLTLDDPELQSNIIATIRFQAGLPPPVAFEPAIGTGATQTALADLAVAVDEHDPTLPVTNSAAIAAAFANPEEGARATLLDEHCQSALSKELFYSYLAAIVANMLLANFLGPDLRPLAEYIMKGRMIAGAMGLTDEQFSSFVMTGLVFKTCLVADGAPLTPAFAGFGTSRSDKADSISTFHRQNDECVRCVIKFIHDCGIFGQVRMPMELPLGRLPLVPAVHPPTLERAFSEVSTEYPVWFSEEAVPSIILDRMKVHYRTLNYDTRRCLNWLMVVQESGVGSPEPASVPSDVWRGSGAGTPQESYDHGSPGTHSGMPQRAADDLAGVGEHADLGGNAAELAAIGVHARRFLYDGSLSESDWEASHDHEAM
ncbi:hypothetical protein ANO11243_077910 [Dothideomycetidae sp. 11243]|nr:hypothetical protein ANO11243_077910 [fungal sp. No.11243]